MITAGGYIKYFVGDDSLWFFWCYFDKFAPPTEFKLYDNNVK